MSLIGQVSRRALQSHLSSNGQVTDKEEFALDLLSPPSFTCRAAGRSELPHLFMKTTIKLRFSLLACGSLLLAPTALYAQDGNWNVDADGDWGTDTNWLGSIIADGTDSTATFGNVITADHIINLEANRTIGNITASDTTHNYTISGGNILTLDLTTGVPTIDVTDGGRTLTISSTVAGSDGLLKTGSGTLTLSGTNTFSGGITIEGGSVHILGDSNLGAATGDITFSGVGSALRLDNTNFTLGAGRTITANAGVTAVIAKLSINGNRTLGIDGQLTGEGGYHLSAGYQLGNYVVNANNLSNDFQGVLRLGGNNSGDYQFTPGVFTFNTASLADDTGYGNIQFGKTRGAATDANVFAYTNAATSDLVLNNRRIEMDMNAGNAIVRNNNTTQAIIINTDTLVSLDVNQKLVLDAATNSTNNEFNGVIANGSFNASTQIVSLDKKGNGAWTLGGVNSYTGNTFVDAGTLELATSAELLFVIGALGGENNAILGDVTNATLNLNGILAFNLTGASTTAGDSWSIVDVDNLNETYGGTFSLSSTVNGSFSETASVWTISENGTTYSFAESTGILTVVPEPSAALLGGLGCLLLLRRRRA
jgi:fibronectin-binding autotransporter adhesin